MVYQILRVPLGGSSEEWMSGLKLAAARKPGPTQQRSSAPLGCAVSQVVKTAQSRGRTERTLLLAGAPTGRMNAADRLDPLLLMSHYCLLHPTHHADKR
jgi:hypothetical protein